MSLFDIRLQVAKVGLLGVSKCFGGIKFGDTKASLAVIWICSGSKWLLVRQSTVRKWVGAGLSPLALPIYVIGSSSTPVTHASS